MALDYVLTENIAVSEDRGDIFNICLQGFDLGFESVYRVDAEGRFLGQRAYRPHFYSCFLAGSVWESVRYISVSQEDWLLRREEVRRLGARLLTEAAAAGEIPIAVQGKVVARICPAAQASDKEALPADEARLSWRELKALLDHCGCSSIFLSSLAAPWQQDFYNRFSARTEVYVVRAGQVHRILHSEGMLLLYGADAFPPGRKLGIRGLQEKIRQLMAGSGYNACSIFARGRDEGWNGMPRTALGQTDGRAAALWRMIYGEDLGSVRLFVSDMYAGRPCEIGGRRVATVSAQEAARLYHLGQIDRFLWLQPQPEDLRLIGYLRACRVPEQDLVHGDDLSALAACLQRPVSSPSGSMAALRLACARHEIISFDIFDTLIMRRLAEPRFLYEIIGLRYRAAGRELDFPAYRQEAERRARQKLQRDCSLSDIYAEMAQMPGMDGETCRQLKNLEIEEEIRQCLPRTDMVQLLADCLAQGKRVILVSDMYLEEGILRCILQKCGVAEGYELYVSAATGMRKDDGAIWAYFARQGLAAGMLHIGDNLHSDGVMPASQGASVAPILSARDSLLSRQEAWPALHEAVARLDVAGAAELGIILAGCCRNIFFRQKDAPLLSSFYDWGYLAYGPFLFRYIYWLIGQLRSDGCRQVLFMARDGFFLQKLYMRVCGLLGVPALPNTYFLASRRALGFASIKDRQDVLKALDTDYRGTVKGFFRERFGIEPAGSCADHTLSLPEDRDKLGELLLAEAENIISKAAAAREAYLRYIEAQGLDFSVRTALVDIGYAGSLQYYLMKMLQAGDIRGYYFATNKSSMFTDGSHIKGCFAEFEDRTVTRSAFWKYHLYFEAVLSSPYGQFDSFTEDGRPVYGKSGIQQSRIDDLAELHRGAGDYCAELINNYADIMPYLMGHGPDFLDAWLEMLVQNERLHAANLREVQQIESAYTGCETPGYVFDIYAHYTREQ